MYLEYKFKQISIYDGICNCDNSNIFFSDGERNFNLFASSIYNVNQVVDSFRSRYPNIEKVGKNKHYLLIIQKIRKLSFIVLCVVYFFKIFFLSIPKKYVGNNVLAISRAYAHKSYFKKFINCVISEKYSLLSFIRNMLSKDFWIIFFYIIKYSKQNLTTSNLKIEPNSNYFFYELLAKYIQSIPSTFLYLILNKKFKINHIVSGEILTAHSTILYFFTKMNNSKMSIVQTVSLFKDNNFYFNFCDHFLFDSFSMYKWFYKNHNEPKNYLFEGNNYLSRDIQRGVLNRILYISQPSLKSIDSDFLIINSINNLGHKIDIRLHPRDKSSRYNKLNLKTFRENNLSDYDLIITRTSSMAVESIYLNIPVIFCLFDDWSINNKNYYIPDNYYGNCYKLDDLNSIIISYDKLKSEFNLFRSKFVEDNSGKNIENLKSFFSC